MSVCNTPPSHSYSVTFFTYIHTYIRRHTPGNSVGIATGYGLDGPGIESRWGTRFSAPVQAGPGAHPTSCTTGTGSFPGVKSNRGVTLTLHPLLVPWSWKGRAIPLLPLWAVRPVQSLSACTRVHFTSTYNLYEVVLPFKMKNSFTDFKKHCFQPITTFHTCTRM